MEEKTLVSLYNLEGLDAAIDLARRNVNTIRGRYGLGRISEQVIRIRSAGEEGYEWSGPADAAPPHILSVHTKFVEGQSVTRSANGLIVDGGSAA